MPLSPLPIDTVLAQLVAALRSREGAVLRAPTGAGKTTRVPPALLDAGIAGQGMVLMLEPRRLAARAAARRMAEEREGRVGDEIGYHVRFDRQASARTRILVVTEGLLVRMLQEDPFLEHIGVVIFDEFHERNLDTDLALALVRKVQREAREDLRLLVMSATIATADVASWLGGAPVIESEGRLHPVRIEYVNAEDTRPIHVVAAAGVARAFEASDGDVLAFLPGVGEIRRTREELETFARKKNAALMELYGDLPADQQDAVLRRGDRRKIVLATNVAETSVTIDGVTAVVDSGLARTMRFDPAVGLDRLELVRISRSSAEQRAGRAGRTSPGIALRLWTEREQRSMSEQEEPEIRRVDLAAPVLQLLCFGETDVRAFPWFEAPSPAALDQALELLSLLGATDPRGLTSIGRAMARLSAHPRIARLLLEGQRLGCADLAALAGALLTERDPFLRAVRRTGFSTRGSGRNLHVSDSDVLDHVLALEDFDRNGSPATALGELNAGAARFVLRARDALLRELERKSGRRDGEAEDFEQALSRALLCAYPDRVARRRESGSRRGILTGGRGVRLADESAVMDAELFVCVDLDAGKRGERAEALVRQASAIQREWLPAHGVRTEIDVAFDADRERVTAMKRTRFFDLVLEEAQCGLPGDEEVAAVLAQAAATRLERALALEGEDVRAFLARVRSLRAWMPELELPDFGDDELRVMLPDLCLGCRSFEDTKKLPLVERLKSGLAWRQLDALEREAPEKLQVPSGSWIRLAYEPGRAPALAVRIQEVFGLADTPRVAGGRVRVVMHLLAPNHRPQQVTEDLRSFWSTAYVEVRNELRRRYPRHAWPEDPWNAPPERRPKRRSK